MNKEEILSEEGKIIHDLTNIFINKNQELERYKNIIDELNDFLEEYEKHRNSFKWNEQDYIDTIEEIKKIIKN